MAYNESIWDDQRNRNISVDISHMRPDGSPVDDGHLVLIGLIVFIFLIVLWHCYVKRKKQQEESTPPAVDNHVRKSEYIEHGSDYQLLYLEDHFKKLQDSVL